MLDLHPCRRKDRYAVVPFTSKDEYQISHTDPIPVLFIYRFYRIAAPLPPYILNPLAELSQCILDSSNGSIINVI